jgi:hypothetical protein
MKSHFGKAIRDHLVALNNEGLQKHAFRLFKYVSFGFFDKMFRLDLQTEYFSEANRHVIYDIWDFGKMLGFKAYNFATKRRLQVVNRSGKKRQKIHFAKRNFALGIYRFLSVGRHGIERTEPGRYTGRCQPADEASRSRTHHS